MLGRLEEADTVYEQVIVRKPKMHHAYLQKGLTAKYRCHFDEARTLIEHACTLAPDEPAPKAALAEIMLLTGDWRAGWPLYEAREGRPQLPRRAAMAGASRRGRSGWCCCRRAASPTP